MPQAVPTRIIDSHTGGEPTRLIVSGGPDLGSGSMAQRLARFRQLHDAWRRAVVNEPRGSEVIVGALLCQASDAAHDCGVIFFNNVGYLGMCGHGTIGLVATLAYLGRARTGALRIETPVGVVGATLADDGAVTVANVPSWRHAARVALEIPGHGVVHGDVAWGGNWFFLCADHGLALERNQVRELTGFALRVQQALAEAGVTGHDGAVIDHVELIGAAHDGAHQARNFVLCPGGAYDRSPCGTGTSAKLACLAADGKLAPGQPWHQESVIGSVFSGRYEWPPVAQRQTLPPQAVLPSIQGRAHVTMDAQLVFSPGDELAWGF